MIPPPETPGPETEPIQEAAIERIRRLGETPEGGSFLSVVIARFREEALRWSDEIRSGLAAGDPEGFRQNLHTLKGSASIIGAKRLAEICRAVEACARQGDVEGCQELLPAFDKALAEVLAALERVE